MKHHRLFKCIALFLLLVCCFPRPALGYIGPGTGMSAVGVFLAVVVGVVVAMLGFIWYPLKRFLRMCKGRLAGKADRVA